jgi:hypothetical protein
MTILSAVKRPLPWLLLVVGPLAGISWSRGYVLPLVMCASFTLTLLLTAAAGALVQDVLAGDALSGDEPRPQPGIFQLLFLGQYAVFFSALLVTPLAASFTELTGKHIPLKVSLPTLLLIAAGVWMRRRGPIPRFALSPFSAYLAALVSLALYRGLSLHSMHAGSIGHDTQSHIYWTEHIADYGFEALTSRGTDLLLKYPRHFHLLVASLSGLGIFGPVGPYVKMMPFLQMLLACGFCAELLLAKVRSEGAQQPILAALALGAFLVWHLTLGDGQEVYRVGDLSGTPRFSAGWVLFSLPLLALAHRVGTLPNARALLIAGVPIGAVTSVGINPSTVFFFAAYSLPVAAFLYFVGAERSKRGVSWKRPLVFGGLLALLSALTNSYVWEHLSLHVPTVEKTLHWLGIRTASFGIQSTHWSNPGVGFAGLCPQGAMDCLADVTSSSVRQAVIWYRDGLLDVDLPALEVTRPNWYWFVFCAPLVAIAASSAVARPQTVPTPSAKLFFVLAGASIFAGAPFVLLFTAVVQKLSVVGPLLSLLSSYIGPSQLYLSSWLLCFVPLSSWLMMPAIRIAAWMSGLLFLATAGTSYWALSDFAPPDLVNHRYANEANAIDWPELRAIEHLNEFVPDHEAVLLVAMHAHINNEQEHVMFVPSSEGVILPYLETQIVFGIGLGSGADYSWADLEQRFCLATKEERDRFLRETNVRWVLIRGMSRTREAFKAFRWPCGLSMKDVGAEYPAAWAERDLALYRINP